MKRLGVSHANIAIHINEAEDFMPNGKDEIQLMFAANLNQSLRPISDVASGGEISRLMLCIKSLIAHTKDLPTIIFDEIDTGVSGEIATQMGTIMQQMAQKRQIIAITHLAQIAAKGDAQYLVYKQDTLTRTTTNIRHLNIEERIQQIASMVAGNSPTHAAIETAKQLLSTH
jgi:DNA repair protein RecN (Recombination protein N)